MATLRADQKLLQLALAPSRTKAKQLIEDGAVEWRSGAEWQVVKSPSQPIPENSELRLLKSDLLRYVSRSGLKLEGAIERLALRFDGFNVLDVGQSTGGFTDCCLQYGAAQVLGIDVGRDQLHHSLRQNPQVEFFEGVNAKDLERLPEFESRQESFDLLVCDVSFISIKKVVPHLLFCLKPQAEVLLLVKPQFELGVDAIGRGGLVRGIDVTELEQDFIQWTRNLGLQPLDFFATKLTGQDGNQEYFLYGKARA
jgi:23S rRNA (cytidine1920-2'-O)/16S rRNA (cytidine1409-2'-O)-methyltransferase